LISIIYSTGTIVVQDDKPSSPIIEGKSRLLFSLRMGASMLPNGVGWTIPCTLSPHNTFQIVTNFLTERGLEYQLNPDAQVLQDDLTSREDFFQVAMQAGREVKDAETYTPFEPPNFHRELRGHQMLSAQHMLAAVNTANFSVPGSGKTTVVYAVYAQATHDNEVDGLLVIGPPSCFMAWENEYHNCFNTNPNSIRLQGRSRVERENIYTNQQQYEIFLISYHTALNDIESLNQLLSQRNLMVVLDESHYVKQIEHGRFADAVITISPGATRRVILTGTPMPNDARDLWTQMTFLWPNEEIFNSRQRFLSRVDNLESIREDIYPFYIRINKEQLGLPPAQFHFIDVEMTPFQRNIYRAIEAKTIAELKLAPQEREGLRRWRRAKMVRLLQSASNPTLLGKQSDEFRLPPIEIEDNPSLNDIIDNYPDYEMPSKFIRCVELSRQIVGAGRKVLIWSWFVHNIVMMNKLLADLNPLYIHGEVPFGNSTDPNSRDWKISTFLNDVNYNVLIANPSACAESISLHSHCHDAIYLDRTFNCGQYLQSLDRIHRIGLRDTDETNYYILCANNTIDNDVRERLQLKEERMNAVINDELQPLNMDIESEDVSDPEIDDDFERVIERVRRNTGNA
jgi:SNF2 family DNA or RNA helicase